MMVRAASLIALRPSWLMMGRPSPEREESCIGGVYVHTGRCCMTLDHGTVLRP